jgi:pyruvate dehydrogenase E1 component beta subunit
MSKPVGYGEAIREAFVYLMERYPKVFAIGQGLWSPWYVGNTMTDLDKLFGKARVIDTPVSELACTGAAVGASLCGYRPIVIHPRMDFMVLAADQVINQAAKWRHMLGGQASPAITVRAIINRGGEQGAQHSQALHSWFAHIPGLRVVMPASVQDARDLLISSVLCDDPVMYIDDRWLYERQAVLPPIVERPLAAEGPRVVRAGRDLTLVAASHSAYLCEQAAEILAAEDISAEVVDVRVLSPLDARPIINSVQKTGRLFAVDGGWRTAGWSAEILAAVTEAVHPTALRARPVRITLPDAPAPTSKALEEIYYPTAATIVDVVRANLGQETHVKASA